MGWILKTEILKLLSKHPLSYSRRIKADSTLLDWLLTRTNYLDVSCSISERVYQVKSDLSAIPKCHCGNARKYTNNVNLGYSANCSYKCAHSLHHEAQEIEYRKSLENRELELIGQYAGVVNPTSHRCLACGYIWDKRPMTITQGCPKCQFKRMTKTHDTYEKELPDHIIALDFYVTAKTKIKHQDIRCGHIWMSRPNDILTGFGCPTCNIGGSATGGLGIPTEYDGVTYPSKLEAKCAEIIFSTFDNNDVERQKRYIDGRRFSCDFYIKSLDLWIEVSNLDTQEDYKAKIDFKRSLVDNFIFARSPKELQEELICTISKT